MQTPKQNRQARLRLKKRDMEIRKPFSNGDKFTKAAFESGGVLIKTNLSVPTAINGGCGAPTHVAGTTGGRMPCGSFLTEFGIRKPYYCSLCS